MSPDNRGLRVHSHPLRTVVVSRLHLHLHPRLRVSIPLVMSPRRVKLLSIKRLGTPRRRHLLTAKTLDIKRLTKSRAGMRRHRRLRIRNRVGIKPCRKRLSIRNRQSLSLNPLLLRAGALDKIDKGGFLCCRLQHIIWDFSYSGFV